MFSLHLSSLPNLIHSPREISFKQQLKCNNILIAKEIVLRDLEVSFFVSFDRSVATHYA
jgi:hypothetical protein